MAVRWNVRWNKGDRDAAAKPGQCRFERVASEGVGVFAWLLLRGREIIVHDLPVSLASEARASLETASASARNAFARLRDREALFWGDLVLIVPIVVVGWSVNSSPLFGPCSGTSQPSSCMLPGPPCESSTKACVFSFCSFAGAAAACAAICAQ